ncbi:MAG: hypothetical protein P4L52_02740 [Acidocella sp.]|nr:hypothetical protein [Acidocella sp.]
MMWAQDYTYAGPASGMPLLLTAGMPATHPKHPTPITTGQLRFLAFATSYGVLRGHNISARLHAQGAISSAPNLQAAFTNLTGAGIDTLAASLRTSDGTLNVQLSLLTKLVTFYDPARFNPCDSFSMRGLAAWCPTYTPRGTYQDFCTEVNNVLAGPLGTAIQTYLVVNAVCLPKTTTTVAFQRRMLDIYLMLEGGRWKPPL